MTEIMDRTAYQRPSSFSEVRPRPDASSGSIDDGLPHARFSFFSRFSRHRGVDAAERTSNLPLTSSIVRARAPLFSFASIQSGHRTHPEELELLQDQLLPLHRRGARGVHRHQPHLASHALHPRRGERPVSDREKLLGMSGASLLAVFFMSSVGSLMFQAFGVALLAIGAHGAMRVPDDLFIDDAAGEGGFFSFLQPPKPGLTGSVA